MILHSNTKPLFIFDNLFTQKNKLSKMKGGLVLQCSVVSWVLKVTSLPKLNLLKMDKHAHKKILWATTSRGLNWKITTKMFKKKEAKNKRTKF